MSGKHTPGPWHIDENCGRDEHEVEITLRPGGWFLVIGAGYPFSKMAYPDEAREEFKANVRLASAAPDLLHHAIEAEAGIREAVRVMDLMGRGGDARELARHGNNLRAAISKATGAA